MSYPVKIFDLFSLLFDLAMKKSLFYLSQLATGVGVASQLILYLYKRRFLPPFVPLWYTLPWGEEQLAEAGFLLIIPSLTFFLGQINSFFLWRLLKKQEEDLGRALFWLNFLVVVSLTLSLARIINLISLPQPHLLHVDLEPLVWPFALGFLVSALASPLVIRLAKKIGAVDDPATHKHPAILHTKPVPRAGALAFLVSLIGVGLIFIPPTRMVIGIYLSVAVAVLIGILDDKFDLSPYLRLGVLLPVAAILILAAGVNLRAFANPLGGVIRVDLLSIPLGKHFISLPADIIAFLWMLWVMNMLSWANGVDGQFSGIAGFTCLTLAILALRPSAGDLIPPEVPILAALSAGAAFGLAPATWQPAKIFWGFGATAVGLMIATLSILSGAKVATAMLVMIVPLADAVTAIIRRVRRGQSPVWGDREHLHHKLLNRGWSHAQIAVFYWLATAVCGVVTIFTAENTRILLLLTGGGLVGFVLILVNLKAAAGPPWRRPAE